MKHMVTINYKSIRDIQEIKKSTYNTTYINIQDKGAREKGIENYKNNQKTIKWHKLHTYQ